jgi:hypothetical protein
MTLSTDKAILRQLQRMNAHGTPEATLQRLIRYGNKGEIPIAIGVVAGGTIFNGILTEQMAISEALDHAFGVLASHIAGSETSPELFRSLQKYEDGRQQDASDALTGDGKEMPKHQDMTDEQWKQFLLVFGPHNALVLDQTTAMVQGEWIRLGTVQIQTAQVAAWWPLEQEAEVDIKVSYDNVSVNVK